MKILSIIFFLIFNLGAAQSVSVAQKPKADLEAISKYAIKFGTGTDSDIYVFVDPLCDYSRALIKKIDENKMLQLSNTYYVFLYRLPILNSEETIHYIYESLNPKETLIDIMVYEDEIELSNYKARQTTLDMIEEIADVAKSLDIKQRPYMISFDKGSSYCRVSEGEASCLEEFDSH
ncbi:MAG: hypothetical protein WCY51_05270 [Sulfurimonas sp.]|uniref:hypothetical protein n=1 Tax=Sulfurimonas sp. TaxID=2022749 RepID=UPI0025DC627E|nr:hypothetical protein [Sulfurimonas sp.]MCK9454178.1 hypothetical protein [Sulfurimonas sp.]